METLCGEATGYHYVPAMIPISPSSMSYKIILDSLPFHFHPKKSNKKREGEETMRDDDVERRMSVRQSECAYKYKEIVVKKCNKYTQIWLNTHTKIKNSLNPQVCQINTHTKIKNSLNPQVCQINTHTKIKNSLNPQVCQINTHTKIKKTVLILRYVR